MSNEILMPALSPTMEEGTLAKWLISEGDTISSGDLIAEIETDKATMEVESIFEGTVGKLFFNEGSEGIKVNTPIGIILDPGEEYDEKVHGPNVKSGSNEKNDKELIKQDGGDNPLDQGEKIVQVDEQKSNISDGDIAVNINEKNRIFASPLAKRIARENSIDLNLIKGSGPHGRIVKKDVEDHNVNSSPIDLKNFVLSFVQLTLHSGTFFNVKPATFTIMSLTDIFACSGNSLLTFFLNDNKSSTLQSIDR